MLVAGDDEAILILDQLVSAGPAATAALINALAHRNVTEQAVRQRLITAIGLGGSDAVPVVEAGIDASDDAVAAAAIEASWGLWSDFPRVRSAALSRCFDPQAFAVQSQAMKLITRYDGHPPERTEVGCRLVEATYAQLTSREVDGEVWFWLPDEKRFGSRLLTGEPERYFRAARLARRLLAQHAEQPNAAPLYALTAAGLAQWQVGLTERLPLEASELQGAVAQAAFIQSTFRSPMLLGALDLALQHDAVAGALGLIDLLSRRTDEADSLLSSPHGQPSPLAAALRAPNRRVRWAAADAIATLHPHGDFKGSCDLARFLQQAINSRGDRVALVIDPNPRRAAVVAGNLAAVGYTPVTRRDGRGAMEVVVNHLDLELIVISTQTYEPAYTELLQELRHDYRARQIPLAVLGEQADLQGADAILLDEYDNVTTFPYPVDESATHVLANRLEQLADPHDATAAERAAHAKRALQHLIAWNPPPADRMVTDLGGVAAWGEHAIPLLGNLGTEEAQQALLNLAADGTLSPGVRNAASQALARSMQQYGINLRVELIHEQWTRFQNQSEIDESSRNLFEVLDVASRRQANG